MGSPLVHCDIPSKNVGQSAEFYTKLFGWRCKPWVENYTLFEHEEGGIGGGFYLAEQPDAGVMVHIMVDDIDAKLAEIVKAGGTVVAPKTQISPEVGHYGMFTDPSGVKMGLFSPAAKQL